MLVSSVSVLASFILSLLVIFSSKFILSNPTATFSNGTYLLILLIGIWLPETF